MSTEQIALPVETECSPRAAYSDPGARLRRLFARFHDPALMLSVGTAFAMFFCTAVQGVLLARLLGPESRGEYGTAVFYTQLLTYVGLLGTQLSIARRAARAANSLPQLARSSISVGCITGFGTLAAVSVLAIVALPGEKSYLAPLCIVAALFLPTEHIRLSLLAIDHGAGRFTRYNVHRLLAVMALPLLLFVAWLAGYGSLKMAVGLSILAPIGPLVLRLVQQRAEIARDSAPPPLVLIKEGVPNALALFASDFLNRLDVFLILWLTPFAVQGLYAAAVPAASLLIVAPNTMALFAFNAGAKQAGTLRFQTMAGTAGAVLGFQLIAAAAFGIVLGPLITIVYGSDFRGAVPFALALLPAAVFNGCALVAEGYLQGRGKATLGVWCRLGGAVVMLAFVAIFLERLGAMSVPLGAIAGQAINAMCILWCVVQESRDGTKGWST